MAFSKAKLKRFNELPTCSPAPGSYDPKYPDKVSNVAPKPEPTPTKTSIFQKFRTPIPVRRKLLRSLSVRRYNSDKMKQNMEAQRDYYETEHATLTQTYENKIDQLQTEISQLHNDQMTSQNETIAQLQSEKTNLEHLLEATRIEHEAKLEQLQKQHDEETSSLNLAMANLKISYENEITELNNAKDKLRDEYEEKRFELDERLLESEDNLYDAQKENEDLMVMNSELRTQLESETQINADFQAKIFNLQSLLNENTQQIKSKQNLIYQLQQELSNLQCEQNESKAEFERKLAQIDQEKITREEDFHEQIGDLQNQLFDIEAQLSSSDANRIILESELYDLNIKLETLEAQYAELLKSTNATAELQKSEIDALKKQHQIEIEDMEFETLKLVTDYRAQIDQLEKEKRKLKELADGANAQIQQANENTTERIRLIEIQYEEKFQELERNFENRLHEQKVNFETKINEFKSVEAEKVKIQSKLDDIEREFFNAQKTKQQMAFELVDRKAMYNDLQRKLSKTILELNDLREHYDIERKNLFAKLQTYETDNRRYVITLNETHSTVEVLRKRLLESDRDVEQLKSEIDSLECTKIHLENEITKLNEQIEDLSKNMLQEIQLQVQKIEKELYEMVDTSFSTEQTALIKSLRDEIIETNQKYNLELQQLRQQFDEQIHDLQQQNSSLHQNLSELLHFQNDFNQVHHLLSNAHEEIETQETENQRLMKEIQKLQDQHQQLKDKNTQLAKENIELKSKLASHDKLKYDVGCSPKSARRMSGFFIQDKENLALSPQKLLGTSLKQESPNQSPLKPRNIRQ